MFQNIKNLTNLPATLRQNALSRERVPAACLAFVAHQLRVRLRGEVIYPWIGESRLAIRKWMPGATGNIYSGLQEFPDMGFALHFLRPSDTLFDVGANVGVYAVLASKVRGCRTLCFEPDPAVAAHLRRNLEINGILDRVEVLPLAVGAQSGEARFSVGLDVLNHFVDETAASSRVVKVVRLDEFADREPTFIKVDVEGFEEGVIEGAAAVLAQPSLAALLIEYATAPIADTLARHGFARAYYDPRTRALTAEPGELKSSNSLFVRDFAACRARLRAAPAFTVLGKSY